MQLQEVLRCGPERLKMIHFIMRHPEVEDPDFYGVVEFNKGKDQVTGRIVPAARRIHIDEEIEQLEV